LFYYESSDVPGRRRLVVAETLRDQVVAEFHNQLFAGHFSKEDLTEIEIVFLLARYGFIRSVSRALPVRQERRQNPALHSIPVGEPFACVGMDFTEMDESFDRNRYALVFQDYLSKWPEVYAVQIRLHQSLLDV